MYKMEFEQSLWIQMLSNWVPAFDAEPIIGICKITMVIAMSVLSFLAICWAISWMPPIDNSKIMLFIAGLIGIVISAHINSITERMTEIEFLYGSLGLIAALAIGLFLPREKISGMIGITVKSGICLPFALLIFVEICNTVQIPDQLCWGFLIYTIVGGAYFALPTMWKLRIKKRISDLIWQSRVAKAETIPPKPKTGRH